MSDVVRKVIGLSILILGAGLLWAGRRSYTDPEDAKDQTKATVAAARERAASGDPRLKGSYSFERWAAGSMFILRVIRSTSAFSMAICSLLKLKTRFPRFPLA